METHAGDVPYLFLNNELLDVLNRVLSVIYEHTVEFEDNFAAVVDSQRVIISLDDLAEFHRTFLPLVGWAELTVDDKRDLPHDRIPVWKERIKQAVAILEQYTN